MFFLRPLFHVFWHWLQVKFLYMSLKGFFILTGSFGIIFVGSLCGLIFFHSHLAKFLFGFAALVALLCVSLIIVISRIYGFFRLKNQIRHVDKELDEELIKVAKKAEENAKAIISIEKDIGILNIFNT